MLKADWPSYQLTHYESLLSPGLTSFVRYRPVLLYILSCFTILYSHPLFSLRLSGLGEIDLAILRSFVIFFESNKPILYFSKKRILSAGSGSTLREKYCGSTDLYPVSVGDPFISGQFINSNPAFACGGKFVLCRVL